MSPSSEKPASTSTTVLYRHKYPWSLEEKIILSVLALGFLASLYSLIFLDVEKTFYGVLAVIALFLFLLLFRTGWRRKKKSTLIATYHPESTELSVEGNGYNPAINTASLHGVKNVTVKQIGINPTLVFHYSTQNTLFVPRRLLANRELYHLIYDALDKDTNILKKEKDVRELFEDEKVHPTKNGAR